MASFAFFLDPLDTLSLDKDSTLQIIKQGYLKGHDVAVFHDKDLIVRDGAVIINSRIIDFTAETLSAQVDCKKDITDFDILFVRRDPPVTIEFYTSLSILSSIEANIPCINSPSSILTFPEKIGPTTFKQLHPPTLISSNLSEIYDFKKEHGAVVVKPLYNYCGNGVYISLQNDRNFNSILSLFKMNSNTPILLQKFIEDVSDGDRRIIMLGGEPVGAINRKASPNDFRCNMFAGGTPTLHNLSSTELEMCAQISPILTERGLHLVGIDIIGNYITEINTTAPTGIFQIADLGGPNLCATIIDYAETLIK
ncbi:glutathione synthase/ribosomal protein S6 modification enzyme (glutaminyl transferase) (plasmid) [Desulfocapsa sulfexigens DSM 10523]|uniref:Glutathione synthetase n=1 Tax=Desulfocapsa sulfexigens (strain DSM 10523 / SB164P1) TaxID=1167006 RepID=M1NKH9_DESSD|nr:glutathione synthase [Desulfocapsa sulfexigens]AGF80094.1 glutathione synthase/ribosomal protein S6 modification enzyme (glutaminyl transferase) [Desulfocapsa sulfexigens DSM 10523]